MKTVKINKYDYEIIEDHKECFNLMEIENLYTDYFEPFDYILGDYSYGKLRLKGFYEKNNKNIQKYNDISMYKNYIKEYCASDCGYILLKKKINVEKNK